MENYVTNILGKYKNLYTNKKSMAKQRVQKIISNSGYCSRRQAEELIEQGWVKVNGKTAKIGESAEETDTISIHGKKIPNPEKIYLMLNKPPGYECTLANKKKNVLQLVEVDERIYPVGRLDKYTTGLLLLTNDGDFANKVIHPSKKIEKTYLAKLDKNIQEKDLEKLNKGIRLRDGKVFPKISQISRSTIRIKIQEGRKHIIKRMLFKLRYFVKDLQRTQIGNLKLDIKQGKWRMLTEKDKEKIFS